MVGKECLYSRNKITYMGPYWTICTRPWLNREFPALSAALSAAFQQVCLLDRAPCTRNSSGYFLFSDFDVWTHFIFVISMFDVFAHFLIFGSVQRLYALWSVFCFCPPPHHFPPAFPPCVSLFSVLPCTPMWYLFLSTWRAIYVALLFEGLLVRYSFLSPSFFFWGLWSPRHSATNCDKIGAIDL